MDYNRNYNSNKDEEDPFAKYDKLGDDFGSISKKHYYDEETFSGEKICCDKGDEPKASPKKQRNIFLRITAFVFKFVFVLFSVLCLIVLSSDFSKYVSLSQNGTAVDLKITDIWNYGSYREHNCPKHIGYILTEGVHEGESAFFFTGGDFEVGETIRGFVIDYDNGAWEFKECDGVDAMAFGVFLIFILVMCLVVKSWIYKFILVMTVGVYSTIVAAYVQSREFLDANLIAVAIFCVAMIIKRKMENVRKSASCP